MNKYVLSKRLKNYVFKQKIMDKIKRKKSRGTLDYVTRMELKRGKK